VGLKMKINKNSQIEAYKNIFSLKQHELEFKLLIQKTIPKDFDGDVLDIGCATGNAINIIKEIYPNSSITGIDLKKELLHIARKRVGPKPKLIQACITKYTPEKKFDLIIASGVLSIFDDISKMLNKWINWLKKNSTLYIYGRFNSSDIDTIVYFRNLNYGNKWESGLNAFSLKTVKKFLQRKKVKYKFKKFKLNKDLKKQKNPIRTFTLKLKNSTRIVVNGANILAEHYHLIIKK